MTFTQIVSGKNGTAQLYPLYGADKTVAAEGGLAHIERIFPCTGT